MKTFSEWLKAQGIKESDLDSEGLAAQRALYDAEVSQRANVDPEPTPEPTPEPVRTEPAPVVDPVDPQDAARAAVERERQRINDIQREGEENGIAAPVIAQCQRDGLDLDGARQVFLTNLREARPASAGAPNIHVLNGMGDCDAETLEAAISLRADLPVADQALTRNNRRTHIDPEQAERADRFSSMRMIDICRQVLMLEGIQVPHREREMIRAAFSTANLGNILENVQNKALMNGFLEFPNTARTWTRQRDVKDFKPNSRVRKSAAENLKKVNNGGEVQYGAATDIKESYSIEEFAELMILTNQDIVNDDLGALSDIPREFGDAASRLESDLVYGALLENADLDQDSTPLFDAAHNNLGSGALDADSLSALISALKKQRGIAVVEGGEGPLLNIRGRWLVVPPDLEFEALQLVNSSEVRTSGSTDVANRGTSNPLSGRGLEVICEPRLSEGADGQSGSDTAFYLFADERQHPTQELGFLQGTGRAPIIERVEPGPQILGMGWRVVHTVGTKPLDFRGMQKSTGV